MERSSDRRILGLHRPIHAARRLSTVLFCRAIKKGVGSLGIFVRRFRFNDPVFATVERMTGPSVAAGLAVLAGLVTAVWLRLKHPNGSPDVWAWPMAVSLACAPALYPVRPERTSSRSDRREVRVAREP